MSLQTTEFALLGGGCFWCVEAIFNRCQGVISAISGYAGGHSERPTYRQICQGDTGHAEVVKVEFAPDVIAYRDILEIFFEAHDPTTMNRQGNDVGTQYRSVIYFYNDAQAATARELIASLNAAKVYAAPVVTELAAAPTFYPAEGEHQDFLTNNPYQPYCMAVVSPKLRKFLSKHPDKVKPGV